MKCTSSYFVHNCVFDIRFQLLNHELNEYTHTFNTLFSTNMFTGALSNLTQDGLSLLQSDQAATKLIILILRLWVYGTHKYSVARLA